MMIRRATKDDAKFWIGTPLICDVMEHAGVPIAMATLVQREDGRRYLHLDYRAPWPGSPRMILKYFRLWVAKIERPVYAACEDLRFPRAPVLLERLGFRPAFKQWDNKTVWVLE